MVFVSSAHPQIGLTTSKRDIKAVRRNSDVNTVTTAHIAAKSSRVDLWMNMERIISFEAELMTSVQRGVHKGGGGLFKG